MKITDLTVRDVIHCKTEDEANRILNIAHKLGFTWVSGSAMSLCNNWKSYKDQTCYNIQDRTFGYYVW